MKLTVPVHYSLIVFLIFSIGQTGYSQNELVGKWRGCLHSPGGELPFGIVIDGSAERLSGGVVNGPETVPFSQVDRQGDTVTLRWDWYDSKITATLSNGSHLQGVWNKTTRDGAVREMPFTAEKGSLPRFAAIESDDDQEGADVTGDWKVEFREGSDREVAVGRFQRNQYGVTGTFLTRTGDYRFLVGDCSGGQLRLSTFDGAHAFLFHAQAATDQSLRGDFWSGPSYHATWTATRATKTDQLLPDPWQMVRLKPDRVKLNFSIATEDGQQISLDSPRFKDKVVLVNVFGTWCPNCNDEAPLLARWYEQYHDQGLEIIGLAFELTDDRGRSEEMIRRFRQRHGIQFPVVLAGTSNKEKAAEALPDLTEIIAYPQTIFVARDGRVDGIHTGFTGPGTGPDYELLVDQMERRLRRLLDQ